MPGAGAGILKTRESPDMETGSPGVGVVRRREVHYLRKAAPGGAVMAGDAASRR